MDVLTYSGKLEKGERISLLLHLENGQERGIGEVDLSINEVLINHWSKVISGIALNSSGKKRPAILTINSSLPPEDHPLGTLELLP